MSKRFRVRVLTHPGQSGLCNENCLDPERGPCKDGCENQVGVVFYAEGPDGRRLMEWWRTHATEGGLLMTLEEKSG